MVKNNHFDFAKLQNIQFFPLFIYILKHR